MPGRVEGEEMVVQGGGRGVEMVFVGNSVSGRVEDRVKDGWQGWVVCYGCIGKWKWRWKKKENGVYSVVTWPEWMEARQCVRWCGGWVKGWMKER